MCCFPLRSAARVTTDATEEEPWRRCVNFEILLGYASTNVGQFVLLAVYRPGSRALSELFFDELSAVFEQLMTYGCPVVVCGDFNIHVDDKRDIYTVRLTVVWMRSACDRANTQRRSHTGPGHHQERDSDFGITCWWHDLRSYCHPVHAASEESVLMRLGPRAERGVVCRLMLLHLTWQRQSVAERHDAP